MLFCSAGSWNTHRRSHDSYAASPLKCRMRWIRCPEISFGWVRSIRVQRHRAGVCSYEFLKLYIIPENTPFAKMQNEQTMQAANAIKAQRIIDLTNGEAGIRPTSKTRILFTDWIEQYAEKAKLSHKGNGYVSMLRSVKFQLLAYMGNTARTKLLQAIDEEFCIG